MRGIAPLLVLSGVFLLQCDRAGSFPNGAPVEACITYNHPNHAGTKPLPPSKFPFAFTASSDSYHPGSTIKVVISGPPFKGFLVQAREGGPDGEWVGSFVNTPYSKSHDECSVVTHNNPEPKEEIVLTWRAPPFGHSGKVVFLATVLAKYDVYWVNVLAKTKRGSPTIHHNRPPSHGRPHASHSFPQRHQRITFPHFK